MDDLYVRALQPYILKKMESGPGLTILMKDATFDPAQVTELIEIEVSWPYRTADTVAEYVDQGWRCLAAILYASEGQKARQIKLCLAKFCD